MRVLKAMLAVAVILGLAGAAAAQSLGQLADQEKQKRQGKPAPKTITEADLAKAGKRGTLSMSGTVVPADAASATTAEATAAAPDGSVPEAAPAEAAPEGSTEEAPEAAPLVPEKAPEPVKPKGPPPKSEEETRAEAKANLQKQLDVAKTNLATHQNLLAQIEGVLNASVSDYSTGRALLFKRQDEEKAAVAKFQDEVEKLEEEIRRSAWPR
jgi:hypothetical protein